MDRCGCLIRLVLVRSKPALRTWHETVMSSSLPPEILNLIIDHLHDEPTMLRACCLVSKSWVPRTRIHLFYRVEFSSSGPTLKLWMEVFPDPSNSPAHYTHSLRLSHLNEVVVVISDAHPWVHSFNSIVELQVAIVAQKDYHAPFTRLPGIFPTLKSLHLFYSFAPFSGVLNCICSFPLLEDLSLSSAAPRVQENPHKWNAPPTLPRFTGALFLSWRNRYITCKLLDLPGGLHFSKITVACPIGDGDLTKELVSACSDTLESPLPFTGVRFLHFLWLINT